MTGVELVREYFPSATDEECSDILWSCTCFPAMGGDDVAIAHYRTQLESIALKSNRVPSKAVVIALNEVQKEMDELLREKDK